MISYRLLIGIAIAALFGVFLLVRSMHRLSLRAQFMVLAVLGVTDYFTIEGYRKLLEFRMGGRLQKIQTILPNIEFRLDKLVGTNGGHRRLNYHVIFSEQISPDQIEEHFLHEIKFSFEGDPQRTAA